MLIAIGMMATRTILITLVVRMSTVTVGASALVLTTSEVVSMPWNGPQKPLRSTFSQEAGFLTMSYLTIQPQVRGVRLLPILVVQAAISTRTLTSIELFLMTHSAVSISSKRLGHN